MDKFRLSNAIDAERFEILHKLYRVTAYVIKFFKILRKKSKAGLTTQDLLEAELLWIKVNQLNLENKNRTRPRTSLKQHVSIKLLMETCCSEMQF